MSGAFSPPQSRRTIRGKKMLTHYYKKEAPKGVVLPGTLANLLYGYMDKERFYTVDSLMELAERMATKEGVKVNSTYREVSKIVPALVADGFILEIFGAKLDKFITSFK